MGIEKYIETKMVVARYPDLLYPHWIEQLRSPTAGVFSINSTLIENCSYRAWFPILDSQGNKLCDIDTRGAIYYDQFSIDYVLYDQGEILSPCREGEVKQIRLKEAPVIQTSFIGRNYKVSRLDWVRSAISYRSTLISEITVDNLSFDHRDFWLVLMVRPYQLTHLGAIHQVNFHDLCLDINGQKVVYCGQKPDNIICSELAEGEIIHRVEDWQYILTAHSKDELGQAALFYKLSLNPGQSEHFNFEFIPPKQKLNDIFSLVSSALSKSKSQVLLTPEPMPETAIETERLKTTRNYLTDLEQYPELSFPNAELTTLSEQLIYQLTMPNTEQIADIELEQLFWKVLALLYYRQHARAIGLLTERLKQRRTAEFGQLWWLVTRTSEFSGSYQLFAEYADTIIPALSKQLAIYSTEGSVRVKPNSDKRGVPSDDLWALASLKASLPALKDPAAIFNLESLLTVSEGKLLQYHAEYGDLKSMLTATYPLSVPLTLTPERTRMLEADRLVDGGCFVHTSRGSGIDTALTVQLAHYYLEHRDTRGFGETLTFLLKSDAGLGYWQELVDPRTLMGTIGDGYAPKTSYLMATLLRHFVLREDGDSLLLLPFLPASWFESRSKMVVKELPTVFGLISFTAKFGINTVEIEFNNQFFNVPQELCLRLPRPLMTVHAEGRMISFEGSELRIGPRTKAVSVVIKPAKREKIEVAVLG